MAAPDADLHSLRRWARSAGSQMVGVSDLVEARAELAGGRFDAAIVLLGAHPEEELARWLQAVRAAPHPPPLIALVASLTMDLVLLADRLGVADLLPYPVQTAAFSRALERLHLAAAEAAIPLAPAETDRRYALVGRDDSMVKVYKQIAQTAPSDASVLIQGESGTGKELVARAIHAHSRRADGPFVAVNCAAIPEGLLESELFGHERGAFTGAVGRHVGRMEAANGGTLFLDEIADMSLPLQAKILRALQEHEIERVGGGTSVGVDFRVIAATNQDLHRVMATGRFRPDLYHRLAVMTIRLPRLAARGNDLSLLIGHFAHRFAARAGKQVTRISDRALARFRTYDWPGNVRELRNVIECAVALTSGDTIRVEHLPEQCCGTDPSSHSVGRPTGQTLAEVEAAHIAMVVEQAGGNIGQAAVRLGIHRNTLARKLRDLGR